MVTFEAKLNIHIRIKFQEQSIFMRSYLSLKHWRMTAVAVFAVLAAIAPATRAFASLPGESSGIGQIKANGSHIQVQGSVAEARSNGHLVDVWEGNTGDGDGTAFENEKNPVWYSYDNGTPRNIGTSSTMASPAVVPAGDNGFMVFFTGTDGQINYAFIFGDNHTSGGWVQIPGQITPQNFAVSAAEMGEGSEQVIVTYRASGINEGTNDQRVWETWYDGKGEWSGAQTIGSGAGVGEAVAPPAICLDSESSSLWAVAIGPNGNQVWTTHQKLGASSWPDWTPQGAFADPIHVHNSQKQDSDLSNRIQGPSCAATSNGDVVFSFVDGNGRPTYKVLNSGGGQVADWSQDNSGWQTMNTVTMSPSGDTVFALITGLAGDFDIKLPGQSVPISHDTSATSGFAFWKPLYVAK